MTTQTFTLRSRAGLPSTPPSLSDSALIVIDAQREYEASGALHLPDYGPAGDQIAAVLSQARRLGTPIIHIAHLGATGSLFDPAAGGQFMDAAAPDPGETVITKTLPNAFAGTELQTQLQALGSPPLVIAGFMTHMCVSATARAALDLGFNSTVLSDATATRSLPSTTAAEPVSADIVHQAALAGLADRFSIVCPASKVLN